MNADIAHINRITGTVIGCAFRVRNTLGAEFLERVYENALAVDLRGVGLIVAQRFGAADDGGAVGTLCPGGFTVC
jgi:hypothetical protein